MQTVESFLPTNMAAYLIRSYILRFIFEDCSPSITIAATYPQIGSYSNKPVLSDSRIISIAALGFDLIWTLIFKTI